MKPRLMTDEHSVQEEGVSMLLQLPLLADLGQLALSIVFEESRHPASSNASVLQIVVRDLEC